MVRDITKAALGTMAALILFGPVDLSAQNRFLPSRIHAGFSDLSIAGCCQRVSFWGWQGGTTSDILERMGVTAEFGGQYKRLNGVTLTEHQFMAGPEATVMKRATVNGFSHVLVGGARVGCGTAPGCNSQTGLAMAVGGGFDVNVGHRIALRFPQLDWLPARFSGDWTNNNIRLSFGMVYTLSDR